MSPRNRHGQTWYQWASELFSFQNCEECHRGVRGHLPAVAPHSSPGEIDRFAFCKPAYEIVEYGEDGREHIRAVREHASDALRCLTRPARRARAIIALDTGRVLRHIPAGQALTQ